jgi:hypothetical protein
MAGTRYGLLLRSLRSQDRDGSPKALHDMANPQDAELPHIHVLNIQREAKTNLYTSMYYVQLRVQRSQHRPLPEISLHIDRRKAGGLQKRIERET